MIQKNVGLFLFAFLNGMLVQAQDAPCDPPLSASISASAPDCSGQFVLTFNLPDDDDGSGFDVDYSVGSTSFSLNGVLNGHTETHSASGATTVVLTRVTNLDDDPDDDDCFTDINESISINISSPMVSVGSLVQPACGLSNGGFTATATGGTSPYQYSVNGGAFQNGGTFSGLSPGSYTLTVRDGAGCTDTELVVLSSPSSPMVSVGSLAQPACGLSNGGFTATATGGTSPYQYSVNGGAFQNGGAFSGLSPGSYTLTVRDGAGCSTVKEIELKDPDSNLSQINAASDGIISVRDGVGTTVSILLNDIIRAPARATLVKKPVLGFASIDNENNLDYQPFAAAFGLDTVSYEVCYLQCPGICDTALVFFSNERSEDPCRVTGDTSNVYTNGITPNGDGRNDYLVFRAVSVEECEINYGKSEIIIYNRWGDIVFEASPYNNDWGGVNKHGKELPPGVYYFALRITLDKTYTQFGSVILVR